MTTPRTVTLGLVQQRASTDAAANLAHAIEGIRDAASRGAQVICLQELFRGPYFCQTEDHEFFKLAEPIPGQDAGLPFSGSERCGDLEVGWYDNADGTAPLSVFQKPVYTFVDRRHARLDEPEGSVDWTVRMTVKRLMYHRIDCATESGC